MEEKEQQSEDAYQKRTMNDTEEKRNRMKNKEQHDKEMRQDNTNKTTTI